MTTEFGSRIMRVTYVNPSEGLMNIFSRHIAIWVIKCIQKEPIV